MNKFWKMNFVVFYALLYLRLSNSVLMKKYEEHLLEFTDHLERFIAGFTVGIIDAMLWMPMDSK